MGSFSRQDERALFGCLGLTLAAAIGVCAAIVYGGAKLIEALFP